MIDPVRLIAAMAPPGVQPNWSGRAPEINWSHPLAKGLRMYLSGSHVLGSGANMQWPNLALPTMEPLSVVAGTPEAVTVGQNRAVSFDGVNESLRVGGNHAAALKLSVKGEMTLAGGIIPRDLSTSTYGSIAKATAVAGGTPFEMGPLGNATPSSRRIYSSVKTNQLWYGNYITTVTQDEYTAISASYNTQDGTGSIWGELPVYKDGTPDPSPGAIYGTYAPKLLDQQYFSVGDGQYGGYFTGDVFYVAAWNRELSPEEHAYLVHDPYVLIRPPLVETFASWSFAPAVGGDTYTADLTAGSFTLTGNSADLLFNRQVDLSTGVFSLTGNSTDLLLGRVADLSTGGFNLTGNAVDLTLTASGSYVADLSTGDFVLAGQDVGLVYNRVAALTAGTFTLTGNSLDLNKGRTVDLGVGTFTLTGNSLAITRPVRVLDATAGTFVLTGNGAELSYSGVPTVPTPYGYDYDPLELLPNNVMPTVTYIDAIVAFVDANYRLPTAEEVEAITQAAIDRGTTTDPLPDGFAGRTWRNSQWLRKLVRNA